MMQNIKKMLNIFLHSIISVSSGLRTERIIFGLVMCLILTGSAKFVRN